MHSCYAVNCDRQIPGDLLMCLRHWRAVPLLVRVRVNRAWKEYRTACADRRTAPEQTGDRQRAARAAYESAREAARASLEGSLP